MQPTPSLSKLNALILAGSRSSGADPLDAFSKDHKAFIDIGGVPMINRVINALCNVETVDNIWVSVPEEIRDRFDILQSPTHKLAITNACPSPATTIESTVNAMEEGTELLVTTCDHALLTPEIIQNFLDQIDRSTCDAAAACVSQDIVSAAYPEAKRTFIRFSDITFSGANLFWMKKGASEPLIGFWRRLENNRKHPIKMASEFGLTMGLRYFAGILSTQCVINKIHQLTKVRVSLKALPFANAAIDVDKPQDVELVRSLV